MPVGNGGEQDESADALVMETDVLGVWVSSQAHELANYFRQPHL
jgi:hypothetical protein